MSVHFAVTDSHGTGRVLQESHPELGENERPESAHVSEPPGRSVCKCDIHEELMLSEVNLRIHTCTPPVGRFLVQVIRSILCTILHSLLRLTVSTLYVNFQTTVSKHYVSLMNCLLESD